jgi:formate hydrogenlyase subunit 3/multisubunit Na+/H+ antiporter MnhD subunit
MASVLKNGVIQYKLNDNLLFLIGEYKISLMSLIFLSIIFSLKLIIFLLFSIDDLQTKKINFLFSIYLVNYFAIAGILTTNNILNLYIYIEIYSITLYNIIADYNGKDIVEIGYEYYHNGTIGSIILLFFVFIIYFTFGTTNIDVITANIGKIYNNYFYNSSVILFSSALFFKFFSFNFYFSNMRKSNNISNFLFINIFFVDLIIGYYLIQKFVLLFDVSLVFDTFYLKYVLYTAGSIIIIGSSLKIMVRKNLIPIIYGFSLNTIGYLLILSVLNNKYSKNASLSIVMNHVLVDFLFYLIISTMIHFYKKTEIAIIYFFRKFRYVIYMLLFSKLGFPLAFGFSASSNFLLSIISEKAYYLIIPFLLEKMSVIIVLYKMNFMFTQSSKSKLVFLENDENIYIKSPHMIAIAITFLFMVFVGIFLNTL